jgi:hypothetical protein
MVLPVSCLIRDALFRNTTIGERKNLLLKANLVSCARACGANFT